MQQKNDREQECIISEYRQCVSGLIFHPDTNLRMTQRTVNTFWFTKTDFRCLPAGYESMKKMPVISSVLPHWKSTGENNYGALGIKAAEQLLKERGVTNIRINSREKALGFYEKLGYTPDFSTRSGEGEFVCIMTSKTL